MFHADLDHVSPSHPNNPKHTHSVLCEGLCAGCWGGVRGGGVKGGRGGWERGVGWGAGSWVRSSDGIGVFTTHSFSQSIGFIHSLGHSNNTLAISFHSRLITHTSPS